MSLEMIIGLLILLVVAAVVINLFMGQIKGVTGVKQYQDDLDYRKFKSECESFCNEGEVGSLVSFCSNKLNKDDLNGNKLTDIIRSKTSALPMCEDGIYCFLVVDCDTAAGKIDPIICKQILCKEWNKIYNDNPAKASCKVSELIKGWGTCKLDNTDTTDDDNENWYKRAGFGKDACGATCPN